MLELARRNGLFGTIRIFQRLMDHTRVYMIGESAQTMVNGEGVSVFGYVHAAKLLLKDAGTVLMIGGGGGSLATMLARTGKAVTVVDIDPASEELARSYFDLDYRVKWITSEAIDFVERHKNTYDGLVVDACDAAGLVAPFNDPNVLIWLLLRACPTGSLIVNLARNDDVPTHGVYLATYLVKCGFAATLYSSEKGEEGNEILHVKVTGNTETLVPTDLNRRSAEARTYLTSLLAITPVRESVAETETGLS